MTQVAYRVNESEAEVIAYIERIENDEQFRLSEILKKQQESWG